MTTGRLRRDRESTRGQCLRATVRCRAIHVVVINAATVIRSAATSHAKGAAICASMCRSAGSASCAVTKRTRRGPARSIRLPRQPRIAAPHELVRRPLERVAVGRAPQRDIFDSARERKVLVGDAARAVRGQLHRDPSPRHRQIGMVICRLRQVANRIHQHQRRRPTIGLVDATDPSVFEIPPGKLLQPLSDLCLVVSCLFLLPSLTPCCQLRLTPNLQLPRQRSFGSWELEVGG